MQGADINITLNIKGKLTIWQVPVVMGIINATPDSFYEPSRTPIELLENKALDMIEEGASIIDIGGYSSRPGAADVSEMEEVERVLPLIEKLHHLAPDTLISIDTFRASVARQAVAAGAGIVNDISAGEDDPDMLPTVAQLGVPYVMMHKKGTPKTMHTHTQYKNVVLDVLDYLNNRIQIARSAGITDIIIDPGFGFAKTLEQNYTLLNKLDQFSLLQVPVLVGVSRKSMIQRVTDTNQQDALNGTTVLHTLALQKGARILRVHDVKEAVECIKLVSFTANQL